MKGWLSADRKKYSRNLQGKQSAVKQNRWGVEKIWWIPILARLHIALLPSTFPGEKPEGVHEVVD